MARKNTSKSKKKNYKLDLKTVLAAIDTKDFDFYKNLSEEEQKAYQPYVLMRFLSSAQEQNGLHEYFLQAINEVVNVDFWQLNKHPELSHKLLCVVGLGRKYFHPWIAGPKKAVKDDIKQVFLKIHPELNDLETKILYNSYSLKEFKQLCKDCGYQDDEIKKLYENFKKIKERM